MTLAFLNSVDDKLWVIIILCVVILLLGVRPWWPPR